MSDLLDDEIEIKGPNKLIEILPLVVIGIFPFLTIVTSITNSNFIILGDLISLGLVIILLIMYFVKRKVYFYGALILLFLKIFNVAYLGGSAPGFTIGIGIISLSIQPLSLIMLIFHLWLFNKEVDQIIVEKKDEPSSIQIEKLKKSFKSKTIKELEYIIISNAYRIEAKVAAKELVKERKV